MALTREQRYHLFGEMTAAENFHRDVVAARTRHAILRETHVVVGDHAPERIPHAKFSPSSAPRWNDCPGYSRDDGGSCP